MPDSERPLRRCDLLPLASLTQQVHCVQSPLRRLFMLEVSKHITTGSKMFADAGNRGSPLIGRVSRLAEAVVGERRSNFIRRGALFSLRHAQRGSARPQQLPRGIRKPGLVAK